MNALGTLYIVATPIGNLQDLSPRAQTVLREVAWIAAEDTRHSRRLLDYFAISTPLIALHEHNEQACGEKLVERLACGESGALISDAGTPAISDPGRRFVQLAHAHEISVLAIPGPSAVTSALSVAGFCADRFVFEGFLPAKSVARRKCLTNLRTETRTLVCYEAPHRIVDCLRDAVECLGAAREGALVKELSKIHETTRRASLADLLAWVESNPQHAKGEFVLIVQGAPPSQVETSSLTAMLTLLLENLPLKTAVELGAKLSGEKKNRVYQQALAITQGHTTIAPVENKDNLLIPPLTD